MQQVHEIMGQQVHCEEDMLIFYHDGIGGESVTLASAKNICQLTDLLGQSCRIVHGARVGWLWLPPVDGDMGTPWLSLGH